jgi:hypothetical protein
MVVVYLIDRCVLIKFLGHQNSTHLSCFHPIIPRILNGITKSKIFHDHFSKFFMSTFWIFSWRDFEFCGCPAWRSDSDSVSSVQSDSEPNRSLLVIFWRLQSVCVILDANANHSQPTDAVLPLRRPLSGAYLWSPMGCYVLCHYPNTTT